MKLACTTLLASCLMVTSCATIRMSEQNTVIVMAKEVGKEKGVSKISDVFTYEGNIYAYITFRWDDLDRPAGQVNVTYKWFNGDKLISTGEHSHYFARTPQYVWFSTRGTNIGTGKCRVEVYADGIFVGKKTFTVVEKQEPIVNDSK